MKIQVLGTGCSKCKTLYEIANKAVQETGVDWRGREGRRHSTDHGLSDLHDSRPGHQRPSEGCRADPQPGRNQEDDPGGQGRLTRIHKVRRSIRCHYDGTQEQVLVVPCSGIGKVHGLISREAVYQVTDKLLPGQSDTVCLALLVTGDPDTRRRCSSIRASRSMAAPSSAPEERRIIGGQRRIGYPRVRHAQATSRRSVRLAHHAE